MTRSHGEGPAPKSRLGLARADATRSRVTLRFADPALEQAFLEQLAIKALPSQRRLLIVMALLGLLGGIAGSVDALFVPNGAATGAPVEFQMRLMLVDIGYVLGAALLVLVSTYVRQLQRWATHTVIAYLLLIVPVAAYPLRLVPSQIAPQVSTAVMLLVLMVHLLVRLRFVAATIVSLVPVGLYGALAPYVLPSPPESLGMQMVLLGLSTLAAMFGSYALESYAREDFLSTRAIEDARAQSDALLLNILPERIANRLKRGEPTIADSHAEATILFADLVGFTSLAERLTPERLVGLLDELFSEFDKLAGQHGAEKIKTIGDAYMVVAGLSASHDDDASSIAELALAMQVVVERCAHRRGEPLHLRIGVHSGPVVAGVIGTTKFAYDLWGDAVNVAARMESHGVRDRIQVSADTWARLRGRYLFEPRGTIEVKGKGPMETYFLEGRKG